MAQSQIKQLVIQKCKVIVAHQKRLNILEIKAAKFGMDCPAHIEMEMGEIREKIKTLESEIAAFSTNDKSADDILRANNALIDGNRAQMLEIRNLMLAKINEYESHITKANLSDVSIEKEKLVELKRHVQYIESVYLEEDDI